MLKRFYTGRIKQNLKSNKVLIIYGPRRVGKTTLVEHYLSDTSLRVYTSTGENMQLRSVLDSADFGKIIPFFSDYDLVFIDEAQMIDNIGSALKIIVDQIPGIKVIATGSSSFDLSNKVGEPLVGRQKVLRLFPLSAIELRENFGGAYLFENLHNLLIYGSYPEVINTTSFEGKQDYLRQIRDSSLFKDILIFEQVKNSGKILDLLRLIAFQIGKQVSVQELGTQLSMSKNTILRYLDLLEKTFVLINVRGYSQNLRKEITKTSRYYFYDNGVRNAVINNFNFLEQRNDVGQLWENYLFVERWKKREYKKLWANTYFWRTWDGAEIDLIEERGGKLFGYEFKWGDKQPLAPKDWLSGYANASYQVINKNNYLDFIS